MKINEKDFKALRKELNVKIFAHFYVSEEIQKIADYVGDSLYLAQKALESENDEDILVMVGVVFMGETVKILNSNKRVYVLDKNAGCSLADSCGVEDVLELKEKYRGYKVISYVNTTAEVKMYTDICCTSSNAKKIVDSVDKDTGIIFLPDRNLGNYIKKVTERDNMIIYDGACMVHEEFSVAKLIELKKEYPKAKTLAHPECKNTILMLADFIGSTRGIIDYSLSSDATTFIVATEAGILFKMREASPNKEFIPLPPTRGSKQESISCHCNECEFMKLNSLNKLEKLLENIKSKNTKELQKLEILLDKDVIERALPSIMNMLEISK